MNNPKNLYVRIIKTKLIKLNIKIRKRENLRFPISPSSIDLLYPFHSKSKFSSIKKKILEQTTSSTTSALTGVFKVSKNHKHPWTSMKRRGSQISETSLQQYWVSAMKHISWVFKFSNKKWNTNLNVHPLLVWFQNWTKSENSSTGSGLLWFQFLSAWNAIHGLRSFSMFVLNMIHCILAFPQIHFPNPNSIWTQILIWQEMNSICRDEVFMMMQFEWFLVFRIIDLFIVEDHDRKGKKMIVGEEEVKRNWDF